MNQALPRHKHDPIPAKPGSVARIDTHYERNGKKKIHFATEPLTGWVAVEITDKRRACEWVDQMIELADDHYPDADCIWVVMDHLNTHNPANFCQFLAPDEAREYLNRSQFHFVPRHESWLNMAETELGFLKRQCLNRRIYHATTRCLEVAAWQTDRNETKRLINWQFTTDDARVKLRGLYPVLIGKNQ